MDNSKFFSVMVVGDEPDKVMEPYGPNVEVKPYVKFKYLEAEKYQKAAIKALNKLLDEYEKIGLTKSMKDAMTERVRIISSQTPFEYYRSLTDGMYYDENGNALSYENPNLKWDASHIGRNFSVPFILKDGTYSYSAKVSDVDWDRTNNEHRGIYESTWELCVDKREPNGSDEERIKQSMQDKDSYFERFKDKEDYVTYSSSFWNYAYVDKSGWTDVSDFREGTEGDWIRGFIGRFVKPLDGDETVSIYECSIRNT